MVWLGANDYFLMEIVARDRVDDMLTTIDLALASAGGGDEAPRDEPEADSARPRCGAVAIAARAILAAGGR